MPPTGKSVSVSFRVRVVRAVRAGEAKLRVRVSGEGVLSLGVRMARFPAPAAPPAGLRPAACTQGFKAYGSMYSNIPRVLSLRCSWQQCLQGFKDYGSVHSNVSRVLSLICSWAAMPPGFQGLCINAQQCFQGSKLQMFLGSNVSRVLRIMDLCTAMSPGF